jgi:signal transduction histidine kinase
MLNLLSNAIKFTKQGGVRLHVSGHCLTSARTVSDYLPLASSSDATPASSCDAGHKGVEMHTLPSLETNIPQSDVSAERWRITFAISDSGIGISEAQLGL